MFGKSADVIAQRRDAKLQAVTTIADIADRYPKTVLYSHKIPDKLVELGVQVPLKKLYDGLSEVDKTALKTGKGCNSKPPGVNAYPTPTFFEFLNRGAKAINVGCYGSYTEEAYQWMKQIVTMNPHTFPGGIGPYDVRLRKAIEALLGEETVYGQNPTARPPETLVEAKYLQLYLLANDPLLAKVGWEEKKVVWPGDVNKDALMREVLRSLKRQLDEKTPMFARELASAWPSNGNIEPLLKLAYTAYMDGFPPRPEEM